jgi:hypothetical protein
LSSLKITLMFSSVNKSLKNFVDRKAITSACMVALAKHTFNCWLLRRPRQYLTL